MNQAIEDKIAAYMVNQLAVTREFSSFSDEEWASREPKIRQSLRRTWLKDHGYAVEELVIAEPAPVPTRAADPRDIFGLNSDERI